MGSVPVWGYRPGAHLEATVEDGEDDAVEEEDPIEDVAQLRLCQCLCGRGGGEGGSGAQGGSVGQWCPQWDCGGADVPNPTASWSPCVAPRAEPRRAAAALWVTPRGRGRHRPPPPPHPPTSIPTSPPHIPSSPRGPHPYPLPTPGAAERRPTAARRSWCHGAVEEEAELRLRAFPSPTPPPPNPHFPSGQLSPLSPRRPQRHRAAISSEDGCANSAGWGAKTPQ